MGARPPLLAVALLSGAALAYEILLTRLFSIILWQHYATMIISIALLGVGAAGTALALARGPLLARFRPAFTLFAVGFALTTVGGFALAQRVPFNPLEIIWDARQQPRLLLVYLLLAVPFFCAASAIALTLARFEGAIGRVYRADLAGAGLGALLLVGLLFVLPAEAALRAVGSLGLAAGAAALLVPPRRPWRAAGLLLLAVALAWLWPAAWIAPQPSPYKGLSTALAVPQARIVAERSSPLGRLSVVESPAVPFRYAPGLGLNAKVAVPEQLAVFTDADAMTAITRFDGDLAALAFLDQQTAALPFHLLEAPRTLVLGAGGGSDVLRALYHGAPAIDAVELDPRMLALVGRTFADFAGNLYARPGVRTHLAEARSFVEASAARWDLINVALLDSAGAAVAGVQATSGSTLYTVEALAGYLDHLAPGGLLALTRWLRVPPRDSVKLIATAAAALERRGIADATARIAAIRGWSTVTLLVKNGVFTDAEIAALRDFAETRRFDLVWHPGLAAGEANRYNRLQRPYLYEAARALLGPDRQAFLDGYPFHVAPATDDSPYFFRFFTWGLLPELLALRQAAALTLVDSGYLTALLTLVQAILASLAIILLPLAWLRRGAAAGSRGPARGAVLVYFAGLGFAFIFVEIAFIQRFTLFLGHPVAAIAVVLAGFLLFAGLGSGASKRLAAARPRHAIVLAVAGIALIATVYLSALPAVFPALLALPLAAKVPLALALIAPLAFAMGMPFPLGLSLVARRAPPLVPWAWAVNGCASVIGAVLAGLLAMHLGFTAVIALALGLYGLAAIALRPGGG